MPRDRDRLTYLVIVERGLRVGDGFGPGLGYIVDAYPEELARYRRQHRRHLVAETPCGDSAIVLLNLAMEELCRDLNNRRAARGRR